MGTAQLRDADVPVPARSRDLAWESIVYLFEHSFDTESNRRRRSCKPNAIWCHLVNALAKNLSKRLQLGHVYEHDLYAIFDTNNDHGPRLAYDNGVNGIFCPNQDSEACW